MEGESQQGIWITTAWQIWYWHTATSVGLRIPRAWHITLAMTIIAILGVLATLGYLNPAALRDLLRMRMQ